MNHRKRVGTFMILLLVSALSLLAGCEATGAPEQRAEPFEVLVPESPAPRGERRFGIAISEGRAGFIPAFETAQKAGVQHVEIVLPWEEVEMRPGVYQDPWNVLHNITFYGDHDIEVLLSMAVIDTVSYTTPEYLAALSYDDPRLIAAFSKMLDWVMATVPDNVTIAGISIGNEVDFVLTDEDGDAYLRFFEAVAAYTHSHYPGIDVGVKITVMNGIFGEEFLPRAQALNQFSDVVMLNYYPQDEAFHVLDPEIVHAHLAEIVRYFPGREIWFTEVGYQSGSRYCNSSEAKQAAFFHEFFTAWDRHAAQVKLVLVDWLHDQAPDQIAEWEAYYGSSDPGFVEYLSTLGLRNYNHTDKAAWLQALAETQARGWSE